MKVSSPLHSLIWNHTQLQLPSHNPLYVHVCARMCVREWAAPSSAQSSKSSAIEYSNQFSWRRTSWKSTVPFTKNTNRNQDEWAGLANHTDYTDVISEDWPESFGALCSSWAGGGLALAGAARPPAGRATRRLLFPAERKTGRRRRRKMSGERSKLQPGHQERSGGNLYWLQVKLHKVWAGSKSG